MVKVTGSGRGMEAIAAHLGYISQGDRLQMEDDRGVTREFREVVAEVAEQWRYAGSLIPQHSERREAFNIALSIPRDTHPQFMLRAAREFAKAELADHCYVMVLHDHQASPHAHLSVRAESRCSRRLNPRKADLYRWREPFAEKLRGWGVRADATRQVTRGELHPQRELWQTWAQDEGRLRRPMPGPEATKRVGPPTMQVETWARIARTLGESPASEDHELARAVKAFIDRMPAAIAFMRILPVTRQHRQAGIECTRPGQEMARWVRPTVVSSPPDGLGGWPPESRQPEPASVGAPCGASRVRLRRAVPALDPPPRAQRGLHSQ